MKGRERVNIGDVVLISLRDFSANTSQKDVRLGDIINMYSREHFSSLKKEPGVNSRLFLKLETSTGYTMESIGEDCSGNTLDMPDDGIEFENSEDEDNETKIVAPVEKDVELDDL